MLLAFLHFFRILVLLMFFWYQACDKLFDIDNDTEQAKSSDIR